jgi:hypothetical protein
MNRDKDKESHLTMITGAFYTEHAQQTSHVSMGDFDDTGKFSFSLDHPVSIEEKGRVTLYTFSDGVVLVLDNNMLQTEWEWKGDPQPPSENSL